MSRRNVQNVIWIFFDKKNQVEVLIDWIVIE